MGYWKEGNDTYVMGIDRFAPKHPQWYWNLLANPEVTVEVGAETQRARAVVIEGTERDRLIESLGNNILDSVD